MSVVVFVAVALISLTTVVWSLDRSSDSSLAAVGSGQLPNSITERWQLESLSVLDSGTLVVVDGAVVHQTSKQRASGFVAIDLETGRHRWSLAGGELGNVRLVGAFADEMVVLQAYTSDATLFGVDAADGALRWTTNPAPRSVAHALAGTDLIVMSNPAAATPTSFIDPRTGRVVGEIAGSPLTDDLDGRWYFRSADGAVSAADLRDGWDEPEPVGTLAADARSAAVGDRLLAVTDRLRFVGEDDEVTLTDSRPPADVRTDGVLPRLDRDVVRLTSAGDERVLLSTTSAVYGGRLDGSDVVITWSRPVQLRDVLITSEAVFVEVVSPIAGARADYSERAPTFVLDATSGSMITEAGGDLGSTGLLGVANGIVVPRRVPRPTLDWSASTSTAPTCGLCPRGHRCDRRRHRRDGRDHGPRLDRSLLRIGLTEIRAHRASAHPTRETPCPMTMPTWWSERRFGLFVHATAATVPAWAPIGEYAEWYRSHLGEDVADVFLHPRPMVEVLAHHRDRWGHVEHYDDFVPLLTFERFDPEAWATLAADAGAGYSVLVTKHHDGWTWWDAPGTDRRLTEQGPRRNVLAEFAAACERHDVLLGTYYSLLDWGDERYPDAAYVEEALHPQVLDLVERYGSAMLWGDGHWAHDAGHWKSSELLRRVRDIDPDVVVNDRWWASNAEVPEGSPAIVRTYEYDAPDDIVDGPWELTRGIAHSFGYNRAERAEHHLTGFEIVALFTEVVAKGGHLLINVGPDADGTIPEMQAAPLRDAGSWIRRFGPLLASTSPWTTWGDERVRYLRCGDDLVAIDVDGAGEFEALANTELQVTGVELIDDHGDHAVTWTQDASGLSVSSVPAAGDFEADRIGIAVYRIAFEHAERPIELFTPAEPTPVDLGRLLADARPGDIVQLGEGHYRGPARVPPGVVLRGLGPSRTQISLGSGPATSIVPDGPVLTVGRNARLEHVRVVGRTRPLRSVRTADRRHRGRLRHRARVRARRVRARDRRRRPRARGDRSGRGGRQRRSPPRVALPLHGQPLGRRCGAARRWRPEHRVHPVQRTSVRGSTERVDRVDRSRQHDLGPLVGRPRRPQRARPRPREPHQLDDAGGRHRRRHPGGRRRERRDRRRQRLHRRGRRQRLRGLRQPLGSMPRRAARLGSGVAPSPGQRRQQPPRPRQRLHHRPVAEWVRPTPHVAEWV